MTTFTVVPADVLRDVLARVAHAVVGSKIDTFVLDRAPDPFDEDVIAPGATSVHGQLNAIANHRVDEFLSGELAALVGVDDVRSLGDSTPALEIPWSGCAPQSSSCLKALSIQSPIGNV